MPGLFQALEVGKRALMGSQLTLQTIGHNIANVNTPGYSRQRVTLRSTPPEVNALGSIGTGISVEDINHVRDLFLGNQFRQENKSLGQWTYKEKILSQMEGLVGEPNDNSLSDLLNGFWDAWSDLSTDPTSTSNRVALVEQTRLLTSGFNQLADQLNNLRDSVDQELDEYTKEVNRLTSEIANLNQQIKIQELGDDHANDLRDTRDKLIDDLSSLVDVNTREEPNGMAVVYVGAMAVVDGTKHIGIDTKVVNDGGILKHNMVWQGTNIGLTNLRGQVRGLLETREDIIPGYLRQLDELAASIVSEVNAVHQTGYGLDGSTGNNFFDTNYVSAANMKISNSILNSASKISVSASGEVGDNTLALDISSMRTSRLMLGGSASFNEFYNGMVGRLGSQSRQAKSFAANYELVINQLTNSRESIQGVSLDEEMTNLVKYQHAYDAAARVITAMDQALDTVISGMGIVGR